jgi:hypothetical protein
VTTRVRTTVGELANVTFDVIGRVSRSLFPTEVSGFEFPLMTVLDGRAPSLQDGRGAGTRVPVQLPGCISKKATCGGALTRMGARLNPMPQVTNIRFPGAPWSSGAHPSTTIFSSSVRAM